MSDPQVSYLVKEDAAGIDLPNLAAARAEALRRIREILNREGQWPIARPDRYVAIRDEDGECVAQITFREAAGLGIEMNDSSRVD